MASYALMPIFSGFRFAMQDKAIGFCPVTEGDFRSIWAVDRAWGRFERRGGRTEIKVIAGRLSLAELELPYYSKVNSVMIDRKPSEFTFRGGKIIAAIDAGRSISVAGELK